MNIYQCPHCSVDIPLGHFSIYKVLALDETLHETNPSMYTPFLAIHKIRCVRCGKTILRVSLNSADIENSIPIQPLSEAKRLPDYIPTALKEDYVEACSIVHLSPKSAAALARRCIQFMLRDFWHIDNWSLARATDELKDKIDPALFDALCDVRDLGNIGAHPELNPAIIVNIEPWEAMYCIGLIEILIEEWYGKQYHNTELCTKLHKINQLKQQAKKSAADTD